MADPYEDVESRFYSTRDLPYIKAHKRTPENADAYAAALEKLLREAPIEYPEPMEVAISRVRATAQGNMPYLARRFTIALGVDKKHVDAVLALIYL